MLMVNVDKVTLDEEKKIERRKNEKQKQKKNIESTIFIQW